MCFTNGIGPIIRTNGTIFYSILYLNSTRVYIILIYVYSVISVNDKRLPGNTKKWILVRSWLIRVRLVHSWAVALHASNNWLCGTMPYQIERWLTNQNRQKFWVLLSRPCTHTKKKTENKMSKKTDIHESKEKIRAHRASSIATRRFFTKYWKQHESQMRFLKELGDLSEKKVLGHGKLKIWATPTVSSPFCHRKRHFQGKMAMLRGFFQHDPQKNWNFVCRRQ